MNANHYEHYIDLAGRGETIQPGHTVKFYAENLPIFPQEKMFRVKSREITYAHESLQTRLYLTSGHESTLRYFSYFKVDRSLPRYGPFQLDVSALDSMSPLDGI
ncbi:MAG: hypothetical protein JXR73_11810 [Candidatus Omnitrophica bacterium]|nr:hypothetical protein [Candidatus Omnitrophota bacterium]